MLILKIFLLWELIRKYFDFRVFKDPTKFALVIYHNGSLEDAKNSQNEMLAKLDDFQEYSPRKPDTIEEKKRY